MNNFYRRHLKLGLCVKCMREAVRGKTLCIMHLQKARINAHKNNASRRQKYIKEHRCTRCSAPVEDGSRTCMNCRDRNTKYRGGIYAKG